MNQLKKRLDLKKMPKAQARVEIAKDVIAAVKAQRLVPTRGHYVVFDEPVTGELRQELANIKSCQVCALGALMVAKVARTNKCDLFNEISLSRDETTSHLIEFFSDDELDEIEQAFEGVVVYDQKYWFKYPDDSDRLIAIMKNIIKNNGTFKP